jgi:putative inorganic carbon (HCO3(-)) transporter
LAVQGLTDTIFFRPEVQLSAFFCLATLAASQHGVGRSEPMTAASELPST